MVIILLLISKATKGSVCFKILCLLCIVLAAVPASGQHEQSIVELKNQLDDTNSDSVKCTIYLELVKHLIYSDIEATKAYNDSLRIMASSMDSDYWRWQSKMNAGTIMRFDGKYISADSLFRELIEQAKIEKNRLHLMQAYYQLASVNIKLTRGSESLKYYQLAADIAENQTENNSFRSKIYNGMGTIHSGMENYGLAAEYIKKSIELDRKEGNTTNLMIACNSLGVMYTRLDSNDKAKEYFNESLNLARQENNLTVTAMQLRNLGLIAAMKGDNKTAKSNYLEALSIRKMAGDPLRILGSHYDLGELYLSNKEYNKSEYHYIEALTLSNKISSVDSKTKVLKGLALLFEQKKDYKNALAYTRQSNLLSDSINYQGVQKKMLELEAQYDTVKKDAQLKSQELDIVRERNRRKTFVGLSFFLAVLALSILAFMRHRMHTKQRITEQATELQNQKIEQLEKEKKILNLAGMIEGQEAERIRIAADLHDGLGGLLTTIKSQVSKIQNDIDELENMRPYDKANAMIDDACEEIRRISHNLMPEILRLEGLHGAIDAIVDQLEDVHGIQTSFISEMENVRLNDVKELFVFRIIQELTNNIVKHAKASSIAISLRLVSNELEIKVEDDGIGFLKNGQNNSNGIGLKSVSSRVNYLDGELKIDSAPENGTRFFYKTSY